MDYLVHKSNSSGSFQQNSLSRSKNRFFFPCAAERIDKLTGRICDRMIFEIGDEDIIHSVKAPERDGAYSAFRFQLSEGGADNVSSSVTPAETAAPESIRTVPAV